MAKQSGIHQIKGKVGEMSYYQQSGVNAGLLRRINQGMSARVKTGEEYANTRRSNVEFGGAADAARLMALTVQPKYRPMFLNFSQAKLTKDIYDIMRTHTAAWGERALDTSDTDALCDALNKLAKKNYNEYFGSVSVEAGDTEGTEVLSIAMPATSVDAMLSLGADGVRFLVKTFNVQTGKYVANQNKIVNGFLSIIEESDSTDDFVPGSDVTSEIQINAQETHITPVFLTNHEVSVVVALPYRTINNVKYTLQELCSFIALPSVYAHE